MIEQSYGAMPTGEAIKLYTLRNANGLSLQAMAYGATITSLRIPDRHGQLTDVVLGFNDLTSYLAPHPYMGAIAGRVAGRITGAHFRLEGRAYPLASNDPPNHLHGGEAGFDRRLWTATPFCHTDGSSSIRFTYRSRDGEEGYPGTVDTTVTYTLTADNTMVMETEATSDQATPFSLTQHSYFNLAGEGSGTAEGHELEIYASEYAPADERMALLGYRKPVAGDCNDFRRPRRLGDALPHLFQSHGDLYFLPRTDAEKSSQTLRSLRLAARLYEPTSGRLLTVSTTEDCLQFYSGISLDGSLIGKSGQAYGPHAGICLECEGYPDGVNTPALGNIILRPGQPFYQKTIYAFSTR